MATLHRYDPGEFTTPGSYSFATGDDFQQAMGALAPLGTGIGAAGFGGRIVAKDPDAEAALPGAWKLLSNSLDRVLGVGWGTKMRNYIENHPRTVEISTKNIIPDNYPASTYIPKGVSHHLPIRVDIDPNYKMNERSLAHEFPHVYKGLRGWEAPAPGLKPSIMTRINLMGGYKKKDRADELLSILAEGGKVKVKDAEALRRWLDPSLFYEK